MGSERLSTIRSCAGSSVKCFLFAGNLLTIIIGIVIILLIVLNLTVHIKDTKFPAFLSLFHILLLTLGGIIIIVSFFGCCGALCQIRCMLLTYISLIICAFVLEFLGGITLYSLYNEEAISIELKNSLKYYNTDKDVKSFWDMVNDDFNCCGVNSSLDWGDNIPNSCCKDLDINDVCHKEQAYETGCFGIMITYMKYVGQILVLVIAVTQLLYILFALCVGECVKES